jgi:GNAT superfamily N-acetyltransferase
VRVVGVADTPYVENEDLVGKPSVQLAERYWVGARSADQFCIGYGRRVSRLEVRAFADDDLGGAASLLAARHREHRAAEPLLSERFEDPDATRAEIASLWAEEHASGAAAFRGGEVVGYLLGTRKDDRTWGANVWIEAAGYAAAEPELVRDLYAVASQRWVDDGRVRHYAVVPALDDQTGAWFRLSFGAQQAHGITAVEARGWPPGTRRAGRDDLEALIALAPLVSDHHEIAPVFSGIGWDEPADELYAVIAAEIADDRVGELAYERDGQVVAGFELAPVERASMHHGLAQPDRAACISWAASRPEVRGSGAGLALMEAAFAWAHEQGYATIVTDWRETNLLSSRFWPARGFRRSFLRLYRSIP